MPIKTRTRICWEHTLCLARAVTLSPHNSPVRSGQSWGPFTNEGSKAQRCHSLWIIELERKWVNGDHHLLSSPPWAMVSQQPSPESPFSTRVLCWIWEWHHQIIPSLFTMKVLDVSPNLGTCQTILSSAAFRLYSVFLKGPDLTLLFILLSYQNFHYFIMSVFFSHHISSFSNVRLICHHEYPSGDLKIMVHQHHAGTQQPKPDKN